MTLAASLAWTLVRAAALLAVFGPLTPNLAAWVRGRPMRWVWLAVLFPLLGFLVNGTLALVRPQARRAVSIVGTGVLFAAFAVAIAVFAAVRKDPPETAIVVTLWEWIKSGNLLTSIAFQVDQLSVVMLLVVTGVGNLLFRGFLRPHVLVDPSFWAHAYGRTLAWKLGLVTSMVAFAALHDFVLGPRASRHEPGSPFALRARRRASWLARLNALLGVLLIAVSVRLARGG